MPSEWGSRLRKLIGGLRPDTDVAAFRNAFHDALRQAGRAGLSDEDIDQLKKAREYCERWVSRKPLPDPDAWVFWVSLFRARDRLSDDVVVAILRRLPPSAIDKSDVTQFALTEATPSVIDTLIAKKFIGMGDVVRIAKERPEEFYRSALLDAAVQRRARLPETVWEHCSRPRPRDLMPADEAVVLAYTGDSSSSGSKRFLQLLVRLGDQRIRILRALLTDSVATERLLQHFVTTYWRANRRKSRGHPESLFVLADWIRVSMEATSSPGQARRLGSFILGLTQLISSTADGGVFSAALEISGASEGTPARSILTRILREMDSPTGINDTLVIVGPARELHQAVGEYIRGLSGTATGRGSGGSTAVFEQHLAVRDVVQGMIAVLDSPDSAHSLRDAVEAALFNAGVRPIGAAGESTVFDPRIHEVEASGVIPGSRVVVTSPGRAVGEGQDAVVIRPARVRGDREP